jgi:hypothetical protein
MAMKKLLIVCTVGGFILAIIVVIFTRNVALNITAAAVFVLAAIIWGIYWLVTTHLLTAIKTQKSCELLGIKDIYSDAQLAASYFLERIANAEDVKVIALSGLTVIKQLRKAIINALKKKARIRILVADPESEFLKDLMMVEGASHEEINRDAGGEVWRTEQALRESYAQASKDSNGRPIGTISMGYFGTLLRESIVLCDEDWGWLTLNLPPEHSIDMPSLSLYEVQGGLLEKCHKHFEYVWKVAEEKGNIKEIGIDEAPRAGGGNSQ